MSNKQGSEKLSEVIIKYNEYLKKGLIMMRYAKGLESILMERIGE